MRNRSRPRSPSDLSLLLITLVLASGLLWAMQRSGQLAILAKGLSQLTSPLQWRISVEALRLPEAFRQIAQTQLTREEQLVLQAENKQLTSENIVLQEILRENESLRSQLGYADLNPRFTFMSAHVVGQILGHDPHSFLDYLLIGAGISDGLEIGQGSAQPALVYVPHSAAVGLGLDDLLGLPLGADEQDLTAVGDQFDHILVGLVDHAQRLLQVDDVDPIALREYVALHGGVPPAGLVAEVHPGLQQRFHIYRLAACRLGRAIRNGARWALSYLARWGRGFLGWSRGRLCYCHRRRCGLGSRRGRRFDRFRCWSVLCYFPYGLLLG